jgi:hypothetical protein
MKYLGQGLFFAQILEKLQKNIDYNIGEERWTTFNTIFASSNRKYLNTCMMKI